MIELNINVENFNADSSIFIVRNIYLYSIVNAIIVIGLTCVQFSNIQKMIPKNSISATKVQCPFGLIWVFLKRRRSLTLT